MSRSKSDAITEKPGRRLNRDRDDRRHRRDRRVLVLEGVTIVSIRIGWSKPSLRLLMRLVPKKNAVYGPSPDRCVYESNRLMNQSSA